MAFFSQPFGGADAAGGLFPASEIQICRNRSGSDRAKGDVVCLDMSAALAALDATDENTAVPGGGDSQSDTIWNTVRSPTASHINGTVSTLFGVCLVPIANGSAGRVQFFGIVDEANVIDSAIATGAWGMGDPMSVAANNFDRDIESTDRVIATALWPDENITNSAVRRRVLLHNGVGFASGELAITVA